MQDKSRTGLEDAKRALRIVSPAYTATAIFFVVVVLAVLIGSFMVRVPVIVNGQGVLMSDTEVTHFAITPETDGRLEEFFVQVGSTVKKGQTIARVSIPRLTNDIETASTSLRDQQQKAEKLSAFHKESQQLALASLRNQRNESRERDVALKERLQRLERTHKGNEELIKQGFMSPRTSDPVATEREQVEDQLMVNKRQLMDAENNYSELVQRQRRELLDLELQISSTQRQLASLQERTQIENIIISPYDGVISELLVDPYQPVYRDRRVATVTPANSVHTGKNLITQAVVFVPSTDGRKLLVGMDAQMLPVIYEEQEFGRIEGVITNISNATTDEDALLRVFKNQKLVRKLFESEAPYRVTVQIKQDPRTDSGLSWTSSRGPAYILEPGLIVSSWMVYKRPRLIHLLVPAVKRLSESAWVNTVELFQGDTVVKQPGTK
jgi:HlyD family secretion protein